MTAIATMSSYRLTKLRRLETEAKAAQDRFAEFRRDCVAEAPAQVGQDVVITSWSYRGKVMKVDHIALVTGFSSGLKWKAVGFVRKKDGSLGQQRGETYWDIQE